jgi:simple sugar transport system ATP-binding protein
MSVTRNFFLGREIYRGPPAFGLLDMKTMDAITREEMHKIGIDIADPSQAVGTLSGGQRQTLAIARAIHFGAPTSALGQKQQMEVLKTIVRVRRRGDVAIVLITHNEVHAKLVADRFTFLALGQVIGRGTRAELEGEEIRDLMAGGRPIGDLARVLAAACGAGSTAGAAGRGHPVLWPAPGRVSDHPLRGSRD